MQVIEAPAPSGAVDSAATDANAQAPSMKGEPVAEAPPDAAEEAPPADAAAAEPVKEEPPTVDPPADAAPVEAAPAASADLVVFLEMDAAKTPLGLQLAQQSCTVKGFRDGGLATKYNDSAGDKKIGVGDRLVSVNGCAEDKCLDVIREAFGEPAQGKPLELKFRKGVLEYDIELELDSAKSPAGLKLNVQTNEVLVMVEEGLAAKSKAINVGDKLISCNGATGRDAIKAIQDAFAEHAPGKKLIMKLERKVA